MKIDADQVRRNGVVGAGGAGFPTYVKVGSQGVDTVIVNAAECEPLLHKDKELLRKFPDDLVGALGDLVEHLGASAGVIGIKYKYHDVIDTLEGKLSGKLSLKRLGDFYPAGDEFILVSEVTSRVIAPGNIPLSVGALVCNVETLLNVRWDRPVTHKYLTVAGAVRRPITLHVPIGVSFGDCIAMAGGYSGEGVYAILEGGAMMGKLVTDPARPVTRTTGGLIVLPQDHELVRQRSRPQIVIDQIGRSACDQCSFCTELCPRYLLGHPIEPHLAMRNLGFHEVGDRMILGTEFCCECNLCTLYSCPEDLDPKNACVQSKGQLRSNQMRWSREAIGSKNWEPHPMEPYRHIPLSKLMRKLGLDRFENVGPLMDVPIPTRSFVLPLRQHIGAEARPIVAVGDRVRVGQVIAEVNAKDLGVPIHASVDGTVQSIDGRITIEGTP